MKLIFYFLFSIQLVSTQPVDFSIATKTLIDNYRQGKTAQEIKLNDYLQKVLSFDSVDPVDPALNSYDFVWDINSVSQLLSGKPWYVYWAPQVTLETFSNPKECQTEGEPKVTRIGIFGQFNRGKTHVLNAIAGLNLPTGEIRHTPGISVKRYGCDIALLDSAGSSVPVEHNDQMLRDRQATDTFLQEILYTNSDIAIVIINILTLEDQTFLESVYNRMKNKQGKVGKIFVVHNFKDIASPQHAEIAIARDIVSILKAKRSAATKNAVVYESDHFYHFIFARAGTEAGKFYNANTAEAIKDIAISLRLYSHELPKFWDSLLESVNLLYLQFLEPVKEEAEEAAVIEAEPQQQEQQEQQPSWATRAFQGVAYYFTTPEVEQQHQEQQPTVPLKVNKVVVDVLNGFVKNTPKDTEKLKLTYTYPSSIPLEASNEKVKWTIGEILAIADDKPLVPGDFILRSNLQFGCGAIHWNSENTFVPKHAVYIAKDRKQALIAVEVGYIEGKLRCDFFGKKSMLTGTHHGFELLNEKNIYDKTYSDITSGTFESEFNVPFWIDREKSTLKHDRETGLAIMELFEQKEDRPERPERKQKKK